MASLARTLFLSLSHQIACSRTRLFYLPHIPRRLFQKVQTLGIFIPGNLGDEEQTKVAKITLVGEPINQTGLKRSAEEQAASTKGDWLGGKSLG